MVYIKPFVFIFFNLLSGFLMVFIIKAFLFIPRKEKRLFGKKVIGTPAFAYRKKIWLIKKMEKMLSDYIRDSKDESEDSRISKWEQEAFQKAWDKFEFLEKIKYLPRVFKEKIRYFLSVIVFEIVKQFLRTFIPYLMEKYEATKYIQLLDKKLDMEIIRDYFNRYVYKYMLIVSLSFFFLIGLGNMIIYLIIK